jgi:hypothetical protein
MNFLLQLFSPALNHFNPRLNFIAASGTFTTIIKRAFVVKPRLQINPFDHPHRNLCTRASAGQLLC